MVPNLILDSFWKLPIILYWLLYGSKSVGFRNAELLFIRALPFNGRAIRFPSPFPEWKSWLGNNLSKLGSLSKCEIIDDSLKSSYSSFRVCSAGRFSSKKIHKCAPLPERERSIYDAISCLVHTEYNFWTDPFQFSSSKSATIIYDVLSSRRG